MPALRLTGSEPIQPQWFLAQTLSERLATPCRSKSSDVDPLAATRHRRWRESPAFANGSVFETFLKHHNISDGDLLRLLGEQPEALQARSDKPAWLTELLGALDSPEQGTSNGAYLDLLRPLLARFEKRLFDSALRLAESRHPPAFDPAVIVPILAEQLRPRLRRLLQRTMVLETNVLRLEGKLAGQNPAERFQDFVRRLNRAPIRRSLLKEYPVLARLSVEYCRQWLEASAEFLQRTSTDKENLSAAFGAIGPMTGLTDSGGDYHNGGRSVQIALFANGTSVVYKPRPLATERHFGELLEWLNDGGLSPALRALRVLDCGEYGWVEFAVHSGCSSPEEVDKFYRRQGALLAALYCVGGYDAHSENLIASGEHPIIIDSETLFHPRQYPPAVDRADLLAKETCNDSVLSTGLLPAPTWVHHQLADNSGLGGAPGQMTHMEAMGYADIGTDEVRIARLPFRSEETQNRVTLDGSVVDVKLYATEIERGFCDAYDLFLSHRELLLSETGPIRRFRSDPVRVVLRPTASYSSLLTESYHPKILRDGMNRERIINQLWGEANIRPPFAVIIPSEVRQLLSGDTPYFFTTPSSHDISGADGTTVKSFFAKSGLEMTEARIRRLGESDRQRQLWIIRASLSCLGPVVAGKKSASRKPVRNADLLDLAMGAGDRIEELAIQDSDSASWLILRFDSVPGSPLEGAYAVSVVGDDLYDGLAGIIYFLSYLGATTGKASYSRLAEKALLTLEAQTDSSAPNSIGAFSGWGGLLYLYTHLAVLWRRDNYLDKAVDLLGRIESSLKTDEKLDVIAGAAGVIPCLLSLARRRPDSRALEIASRCGDHLLSAAVSKELRIAREKLSFQRGFSHGLSGIAWALHKLGSQTGAARFSSAALDAIALERGLLTQERWTDRQALGKSEQATWCHGAHGIALSRIDICKSNLDPAIRADAHAALQVVLKARQEENHSLCHGALGNIEPLLSAAQCLSDEPIWAASLADRTTRVLNDIRDNGYRCATPNHIEVPGLMTGLAGIGYGLLRLARPSQIPSVLTLSAP